MDASTVPPLGMRKLVVEIDDPRLGLLAYHPADLTSALTQIQYNLDFNSFLVLWSSISGIPDTENNTGTTGTPPPGASIADRTYGILLQQPWSVRSTFSVDASGVGTLVGPAGPGNPWTVLGPPSCSPISPCAVIPLANSPAVLGAPLQCRGAAPGSPCTVQNADATNYEH